MVIEKQRSPKFQAIVEDAVRDLVCVRHRGEESYINVPLIYPDGSFVTVRVESVPGGFRVSDCGFAYRELESVGSEASFGNTASRIAEKADLQYNRRVIWADVDAQCLTRAICDVSLASWRVTDRVFSKLSDGDEEEIQDHLQERLVAIFGENHVVPKAKIEGASQTEWDVSAIVKTNRHRTVFNAVGEHPNSIYKTSSAWHDLASLEHSPTLVSVVRDPNAFGSKLGLLSRVSRIVTENQPDEVYRRATQ